MRNVIVVLALLIAAVLPVFASQRSDSQPVVLYVDLPGDAAVHEFTLDDLRALPAASFETATIWTSGPQQFSGVPLSALLQHLGVYGGVIEARAVNDYAVEIPVSDAVPDGPILAYERNGALMPVRDKGPLWLVYPYDSDPGYRTEAVYSRSIWQLERIVVKQ
ncbi:molybdopterin-dependent oxidoreductase [Roseobacteraceae bacterium NS-SX3]